MKKLERYKDVIAYAFFGVCTTVINIAAYAGATRFLRMKTVPATVIAWIIAVMFAYATNRKWVFHSGAKGAKAVIEECFSFFLCRLLTGGLDIAVMYVGVDLMHLNDLAVKVFSNVLVIVLNYVASKLVIFKKG